MDHDVTSCVICILNDVKIFEKEASYKYSAKEVSYIVILSDLCNAIKILL